MTDTVVENQNVGVMVNGITLILSFVKTDSKVAGGRGGAQIPKHLKSPFSLPLRKIG
jgi:hypothetical protein